MTSASIHQAAVIARNWLLRKIRFLPLWAIVAIAIPIGIAWLVFSMIAGLALVGAGVLTFAQALDAVDNHWRDRQMYEPANSSFIERVQWDNRSGGTLLVKFRTEGLIYTYSEVPKSDFLFIKNAPSAERAFNSRIRPIFDCNFQQSTDGRNLFAHMQCDRKAD